MCVFTSFLHVYMLVFHMHVCECFICMNVSEHVSQVCVRVSHGRVFSVYFLKGSPSYSS